MEPKGTPNHAQISIKANFVASKIASAILECRQGRGVFRKFPHVPPPAGANMSAPSLPISMSERANAIKICVFEISQMLHSKNAFKVFGAAPCSLRRFSLQRELCFDFLNVLEKESKPNGP